MTNALSPENRALVERALGYDVSDGFLISSAVILNALLDAAREEARLQGVPEGWVVVPREPTGEMVSAACRASLANEGDAIKELAEVYRAMIASAPVPSGGWRPIETAPKDRKAVLIWCPDRQNIYAAVWCELWSAGSDLQEGWTYFGGRGDLREEPTHWMPLPSPPIGEGG